MEPLLLVEDKNELRAMLRKALERNGYDVDEAPDGSSAIQKLRLRRYQLVLTDLKMPGASGLDDPRHIAHRLRLRRRSRRRHERGCLRLPAKARRSGSPQSFGSARRAAAGTSPRESTTA